MVCLVPSAPTASMSGTFYTRLKNIQDKRREVTSCNKLLAELQVVAMVERLQLNWQSVPITVAHGP